MSANALFGIIPLAIVAISLALFGFDKAKVQGPEWVFVVYVAIFGLKLFIDDFGHFLRIKADPVKSTDGFTFSLIMWCLIDAALLFIPENFQWALFLMIATFCVGTIWIGVNYIGDNSDKEPSRHKKWIALNCAHTLLLAATGIFGAELGKECLYGIFIVLCLITLLDLVLLRTIPRAVRAL